MYEDSIEMVLICPHELSDADWAEIAKLAKRYGQRGEKNFTKCAVLAYVEWLEIDSIERRKQ